VRLINAIHVAPGAVLEVQYVLLRGQLPPGASGEAFVEQGLQIKAAATTATNVVTRDANHLELGLYYVKQPATPGSSSNVPSGQWSLSNTGIYWEASASPMVPLAAIVAPVVVGCALLGVLVALFLVYRRRQRGQGSSKGNDYEKANGARPGAPGALPVAGWCRVAGGGCRPASSRQQGCTPPPPTPLLGRRCRALRQRKAAASQGTERSPALAPAAGGVADSKSMYASDSGSGTLSKGLFGVMIKQGTNTDGSSGFNSDSARRRHQGPGQVRCCAARRLRHSAPPPTTSHPSLAL
jgi:hypothetical protein